MPTTISVEQDTHVQAELDRHAYNAAFHELGLRWHWDERMYEKLSRIPHRGDRMRTYLELCRPHMLRAYDCNFLANAIEELKTQCREALASSAQAGRNVGINWSEFERPQLGV